MRLPRVTIPLLLLALSAATPARATFSIAACTPDGACGVAVATHNLGVGGAGVPWAQAGVGAIASQFETHPHHGRDGLALLARGASPARVLEQLLARDGDYDGGTTAERQIGIVDAKGRQATWTGDIAADAHWAGAAGAGSTSVQGNGLAGPEVLDAMQARFAATSGELAERLLAALEAGQAAGGQSSGQWSAALLVRTRAGGWQDTDLRVDADPRAVTRLRDIFDMRRAHAAVIRAEQLHRRGDDDNARMAISEALSLAPGWDRIWARSARLSMHMGDAARTRDLLGTLHGLNPTWARQELQRAAYAPLLADPLVQRWAGPDARAAQ